MAIDYDGVMKDAQRLGMLTTDELDSLSNEVASVDDDGFIRTV